MFKIFLDKLYGRSPQWRTIRNIHIENHPECEACGTKEDLEVHHVVPYNVDKSKELDPSNLVTLCGKHCHFIFGHLCDWKSWNTNVLEDCKNYRNKINSRPYMKPNYHQMETKYENTNHTMPNLIRKLLHSWNNRSN